MKSIKAQERMNEIVLGDEKTLAILDKSDIKFLCGAIAGDIIGSIYEFRSFKETTFPLFCDSSEFTDDTVMTVANAEWLLSGDSLLGIMQDFGNRYPVGYGGMFWEWLHAYDPQPYNSWGNGSAMRVSPVGWAFDTLEKTLEAAKQSAEITHNHPEGIKGAQATAACIFMARTGKSKQEIKEYIEDYFGYNLNRTCDEIRPNYHFDESCQGTVPESIIAFLESSDFESAIRLAVSLGGDADTMGAITGGIAEAFYGGVPKHIRKEVLKRLPNEFIDVMSRFYLKFVKKYKGMKYLLVICVMILSACNLTKQKEITNEQPQIFITYKQPVNGYNVKVACFIDREHYGYYNPNAIWGEGELIFKNEKHVLIVKNPSFTDENLLNYNKTLQDLTQIEVDYTPYKLADDGTLTENKSPFFFFDIDFDDEEELIICQWEGMAYHVHHTYQAYKVNVPKGRHTLSPMQKEPFNELNNYTIIDTINKTISIPLEVSLKMGGYKIYGLSDSEIELKEIDEYDWEHTKGLKYEFCEPTVYHYKMINGDKHLMKIQRCSNDTIQ